MQKPLSEGRVQLLGQPDYQRPKKERKENIILGFLARFNTQQRIKTAPDTREVLKNRLNFIFSYFIGLCLSASLVLFLQKEPPPA